MSMRIAALLGAVAVMALAVPATTGASARQEPETLQHVIDNQGRLGGVPVAGWQMEELPAVFANPESRRRNGKKLCDLSYPDQSLTLTFYAGPYKACFGFSEVVYTRMTGDWKTSKGLAVGDPVARIRQLYPHAGANVARCGRSGMTRLTFLGPARGIKARERTAIVVEKANGKVSALRLCVPSTWHYAGP